MAALRQRCCCSWAPRCTSARLGRRRSLTAFRVYDGDLPEYPFAIDAYAANAHVIEYPRKRALREGTFEQLRAEVVAAVEQVMGVPPDRIFTKTHEQHAWGQTQ